MKHLTSPLRGASETQVKVPTRRALAKQQTRAKVLAAARRLFSEQGYEGATIRDIAAAAGMSTGAVFASFADKSDLFREIMFCDIEALREVMREAADRAQTVDAALLAIFTTGYAFYKSQLPLARAAFSVSWSTGEERERIDASPAVDALRRLITEQLSQGVVRGELDRDGQLDLRSEMLFDSYLSNYRQAIYLDWRLEELQIRSRDQIDVILAGARKR